MNDELKTSSLTSSFIVPTSSFLLCAPSALSRVCGGESSAPAVTSNQTTTDDWLIKGFARAATNVVARDFAKAASRVIKVVHVEQGDQTTRGG
jgi:hypothetical protein